MRIRKVRFHFHKKLPFPFPFCKFPFLFWYFLSVSIFLRNEREVSAQLCKQMLDHTEFRAEAAASRSLHPLWPGRWNNLAPMHQMHMLETSVGILLPTNYLPPVNRLTSTIGSSRLRSELVQKSWRERGRWPNSPFGGYGSFVMAVFSMGLCQTVQRWLTRLFF